jgi:C4-dicarboxylate transporter DctM subunit
LLPLPNPPPQAGEGAHRPCCNAYSTNKPNQSVPMSGDTVAIIGFVVLFVLMLLRVPVGMAMGLVGVGGFAYIVGGAPALKNVGHTTARTVTDYNFAVIPLFLLMGSFATTSGMSRELFRAANAFLGHLRGGLGIATIAACGGFAAICGSSVATAATFSRVAYPEMRRFGYPQSFATGVIAAGGTLGIMIPPSTVLAIYGLITEQDVGKLFVAGILPGLLAVAMYMITITLIGVARPGFLPAGQRTTWAERRAALRDVWATLLLFAFVIGGLYGGLFTATEAAGAGAGGAFLIGLARGRLSRADIMRSLLETTRTTAAVFTVLIGALLFGYFLTVTQTPQKVTELLAGLGIGKYGVLALIMVMYLVLGCLMDALAMIILTVPIVFPVIKELGFDPIWFGVIIVMTVELGLIHPPVGMNIFVIKSVIEDVKMSTMFYGVTPFIITDLLRLIILIAFPIIALWLPSRM